MSLPRDINQVPYNELSGLIKRQGINPEHHGGYGDIFIGHLKDLRTGSRSKVAIKILRVANGSENIDKIKKYLVRETVVWQGLRHSNILGFLGLASDHERFGCPALISPYCDKGDVNGYLKTHPSPTTRLSMIQGVSEGLQYLHGKEVVHGDLKPSNVLVSDDGRPLLCDFGRSKILDQRGFTTQPSGVYRYQAPEIHGIDVGAIKATDGGVTKATDMYAFAATSYEIWTGRWPFDNIPNDLQLISMYMTVQEPRPRYPDPAPPGTDSLWAILDRCWERRPETRWNAAVVVQRLKSMNTLPS